MQIEPILSYDPAFYDRQLTACNAQPQGDVSNLRRAYTSATDGDVQVEPLERLGYVILISHRSRDTQYVLLGTYCG